jgi:glycosyltransferase involved in cell wall biosynthesis
MRVCYFGTYRDEYSRNRILLKGLQRAGVEVVVCHAPLWRGIDDRVRAAEGRWANRDFLGRVWRAYGQLLQRYRQVGAYDLLLVGYPGQFDIFLARALAGLRGRPVALDLFMSIALIAEERGLARRGRLTVRALRAVEWLACRLPHLPLADTREYAQWYARRYGVDPARFALVPTGADSDLVTPQPPRPSDGALRVLYAGTFIPNHGVPYMLEAVRQLQDCPEIEFTFVGDGPDRPAAVRFVEAHGLRQVRFGPWLEPPALLAAMAAADVCLGAFGQTPQSLMTVQNKIYEALAARRPVVSGDSPAVRAALVPDEQICLVDRGDPARLAAALRRLQADPAWRARLAEQGHAVFRERYDLDAIGRVARGHLEPWVRR